MNVELPRPIQKRLASVLRRAGRLEVGGVLMGEQIGPDHFRIVDFTLDDQTGGPAHFVRSAEQHQIALWEFFKASGSDYRRFNYLGEWHSHPQFSVNPSTTDAMSMFDLVRGERNIDFAFLMIVRLDYWVKLSYSITLFKNE
jgi:integrative and conjugative element protein (TIGR02256 family)